MNGKRAKAERRAGLRTSARRPPIIEEQQEAIEAGCAVLRANQAVRRQRSGVDRPAVLAAKAKRARRQQRNLALR